MKEKLEYEEKLKRQCTLRKALLRILVIVVYVGFLWELIPHTIFKTSILEAIISLLLCMVALFLTFCAYDIADNLLESHYKSKKSDFDDEMAEREFFQYLGERRLELEVQLDLEMASEEFIKAIRNPNAKWYVEREGQDSLYIAAYDGTEKIWDGVEDYEFFDLYFKELVHHSDPVLTEDKKESE